MDKYRYEYNKDGYAVMTATNGPAFKIKVTGIKPEIGSGNQTNVIVYIPNQNYALILPATNVNITVTSNASPVLTNLPSDYGKTLNSLRKAIDIAMLFRRNKPF